jgi:enediyne core biosynthesis thioesterase
MNSTRAYSYRHVVCFEDTNKVGNVYYANFVAWQGRVRELFLRQYAPRILQDLDEGLLLATLNVSCDYFHELLPFDEVLIELRLGALTATRMTLQFEYWRLRGAERELVAKGQQRIGCVRRVNGTVVGALLPDHLRQALESFHQSADELDRGSAAAAPFDSLSRVQLHPAHP